MKRAPAGHSRPSSLSSAGTLAPSDRQRVIAPDPRHHLALWWPEEATCEIPTKIERRSSPRVKASRGRVSAAKRQSVHADRIPRRRAQAPARRSNPSTQRVTRPQTAAQPADASQKSRKRRRSTPSIGKTATVQVGWDELGPAVDALSALLRRDAPNERRAVAQPTSEEDVTTVRRGTSFGGSATAVM